MSEMANSSEQKVQAALAQLDLDQLRDLIVDMVNIPSPTGDEAPLARILTDYLSKSGLEAFLQPLDERQANAVGRYRSIEGDGAELLLYAPIDTHLSGDDAEDVPWSGPEVEPIRSNSARVKDMEVSGLGAENPKSYAACVITAARCLALARVQLRGDLIVGLGSGGMPTNKRPGLSRWNIGHGAGVGFMLQQGVRADFAVIAKPVWAVSWEEVGLAWFRVSVGGLFGYAGLRHMMPYHNAIVDAATVVSELEEWLPKYAEAETSGLVAPQGVISAIEGGFTYKPAFLPARCDIYLDIRVSPRTDPVDVKRALATELRAIQKRHPQIELSLEMLVAIPGSHTSPDNWIIQSAIRSWETVEGRKHEAFPNMSGATDVAILRMWGIPTARLGVPLRVRASEDNWAGADPLPMNLTNIDDCAKLVEALIRIAVDTCDRSIDETRSKPSNFQK